MLVHLRQRSNYRGQAARSKSILIRQVIKDNPNLGNTELADRINSSDAAKRDKIQVKSGDIAAQKQAMKKGGGSATAAASKTGGNGRKKGAKKDKPAAQPTASAKKADGSSPLEVARQVKELCERYGAETVKGLAELFGK